MPKRIPLFILLLIQALGGSAITLAHARHAVAAPPGFEARHDGRCAILHDELRCALCHYASARVLTSQTVIVSTHPATIRFAPTQRVLVVVSVARRTAPARGPPLPLS